MRALLSVYDKTGVVELARGLHELGWELVSSGGTAEGDRRGRHPRHRRRRPDRVPGDPRPPGRHAAPEGPRRHPRRPRRPEHWPTWSEYGIEAHRPGRSATSTRSAPIRRLRARWRRRRGPDRHRRPGHDAGRGQEPRARRRRHRPGRLRRRRSTSCAADGALSRRDPAPPGPHGLRPHRGLRRRDRRLVRRGRRRRPLPPHARTWPATPRAGRAALRREPAPGRPPATGPTAPTVVGDVTQHGGMALSATSTSTTPTPPGGWSTTSAASTDRPGRRHHQARQPVRRRGGRHLADGLPAGLRVRRPVGVRRHRRRSTGRSTTTPWSRWSPPPRPTSSSPPATRPAWSRRSRPSARTPGCSRRRRPTPDARHLRPISGGWLVQEPHRFVGRPADWQVVTERQPDRRPSGRRRAGLPHLRAGQVQRHRPGQGRRGVGHRRRPAEPGRGRPDRGREGGRAGRRRRLRQRRLLPVPRRHRGRGRGRRRGRRPARRLGDATTRSSPRPTSSAWPWSSPASATSCTEVRAGAPVGTSRSGMRLPCRTPGLEQAVRRTASTATRTTSSTAGQSTGR